MASFMFILVAALIATSRFSEASTEHGANCSVSMSVACQADSVFTEFPQTHEEFDAACERVLKFATCMIEHEGNCGKREIILEDMRQFKNIAEQVCNKETHLYSAIADNLVCIQNSEGPCHLKDDEELAKFEDKLKENGISTATESEMWTGHCTGQLYYSGCVAARIGNKCGETARNAITEIYQNFIFPSDRCPEELVNDMPKVVIILQEELLKEEME